MYIHKIIDNVKEYEWDTTEGTICPYKDDKTNNRNNGYCYHCWSTLAYFKNEDQTCAEEETKTCMYPEVDKLIISLNKFHERYERLEPMDDFCPIEMFEGYGLSGPERRIDPELVIHLVKDNIKIINEYLKWNDEEYTKEEWGFIQASILTHELQKTLK